MNKEELLQALNGCDDDPECHHSLCDYALLEFIDDEEITEAFFNKTKWYA